MERGSKLHRGKDGGRTETDTKSKGIDTRQTKKKQIAYLH